MGVYTTKSKTYEFRRGYVVLTKGRVIDEDGYDCGAFTDITCYDWNDFELGSFKTLTEAFDFINGKTTPEFVNPFSQL